MEYAWFNNVETKPGIGYPKDWENQERWNGGWVRKRNGKLRTASIGGKWRVLAKIFANPDLPEIDDYYEPFTFDYDHLQKAPELDGVSNGAAALADLPASAWKRSSGARTGRRFWAASSPSDRCPTCEL